MPPLNKCGFHGPDSAFVLDADLRAAVVKAAVDERTLWFDSGSKTFQNEITDARFGDLVRYWLAGHTGTIRPGKLEAVQKAAIDSSVKSKYGNLTNATLNAAIQKFSAAEAKVNARSADVYKKSDDVDSATAKVKEANTQVRDAAAAMTAAEAAVKAAHSQSGSGAQAALNAAKAALSTATTALNAARKDRSDAGKALDVTTTALKATKESHEKAKSVRDSLKDPAKNWKLTDRQKVRKAILAKAGSTDPQKIDDLVEEELLLAHRSRADIEAWSAVFVVSCVRKAAIGLKLEAIDSSGAHRGRDGLLKASRRHSDYIVEARERKRKAVGGTYHAFEPADRKVDIGDIICTDRTDFIGKPARLKDVKPGLFLHGDIVTLVKTVWGLPVFAETIGGNVGHTVRRRRYPLNGLGRLVVSPDRLFDQEPDNGTLVGPLPTPTLPPAPTMLSVASTGRIFALLSLVEECKGASATAPTGKGAPSGK
ncbi:MAG: DUF2272 domain-containing protein, partial [bacterium]